MHAKSSPEAHASVTKTRSTCNGAGKQKFGAIMSTRTEGAKNQVKGTAKEVAGKVTGNTSQEVEGKVQKNVGKAQGEVGKAVDHVKGADRKR